MLLLVEEASGNTRGIGLLKEGKSGLAIINMTTEA